MTEFVNVLASANKKRRLRTIAAWGDSITAGGNSFSGTVNPTTAGVVVGYNSGYAETLIRSSGRWAQVANAGYPGQTAAQILARYAVDVKAYDPDAVLIMMGTNDLVSGMSNTAMRAVLQAVETAIKTVLQDGRLPILVTPPPKNNAALEARVFASFLYDIADYYEIPFFDLHRLLVNAQTGGYASGTTFSGDGVHPNDAAIALIASQFAAFMRSIETYASPWYMDPVSNTTANQTVTNLLRNGCFAYSVSAPTPDSWTVNTTNATHALNAIGPGVRYPYTGNEFEYVKSAAGGIYALFGASPTVVPGNKMRISGSISVSGLAASPTGFQLGGNFGAGYFRPFQNWRQNGDFDFAADFTVPTGQTTFAPNLYVQDAGTYKVRNLTLIDLTARAAIYAPGQI